MVCVPCDAAQHAIFPKWYPSNTSELNDVLDKHNAFAVHNYAASIAPQTVRAIIAPHAGMQYSGSVAAAVYRFIDPKIRRIIVLAPDHSGQHSGVLVPSISHVNMPNGTVKIDTTIDSALAHKPYFARNNDVVFAEHAVNNQFPFIARYAVRAKVIPLLVGRIDCTQAATIAKALKRYINKKTVVILSTDFVHYGLGYNFTPFADHQQLRVRHLNSEAISLIEYGGCQEFQAFIQQSNATICGANALKVLLALLQDNAFGPVEPRLIAYDSSSKSDQGDFVTYVGMLFTTESLARKAIADQLTQQEQRGLLQQANDVLAHMFDSDFDASLYNSITSFGVTRPLGAFTTLRTLDGSLRGCIGRIISERPLYQTIARVTQDAALRDSRFAPVTKKEVPALDVNLSILSAPVAITNYNQIQLGTDGIILSREGKSAVYLPSVATDQKWNLAQTLSSLSRKAGLPSNVWKKAGTQFKVFSSLEVP